MHVLATDKLCTVKYLSRLEMEIYECGTSDICNGLAQPSGSASDQCQLCASLSTFPCLTTHYSAIAIA